MELVIIIIIIIIIMLLNSVIINMISPREEESADLSNNILGVLNPVFHQAYSLTRAFLNINFTFISIWFLFDRLNYIFLVLL